MSSTPVYPNLAGVITSADIKQKGTGSYAADYVPWAKVMQLINQHANGWLPELITADDSGYVHKAPDGTGYLCIQFVNGTNTTPIWIYAITDSRNIPIPYDKITSRNITDSHRRGICSAACGIFALAYALWAREEIETSSNAETVETQPEIQLQQTTPRVARQRKVSAPTTEPTKVAPSADTEENIKKQLIDQCVDLIQDKLDRIQQVAWIADKATKWDLDENGSKLAQMTIDQLTSCIDDLNSKPNLKR